MAIAYGNDYEILTDSSCNLTEEMIDEAGVHIFPLTFEIDGKHYMSYLKGEKTDLSKFYQMMREGKTITTSLPNLDEAEKAMRERLDAGKDLLYIGFSSGLSGTFSAIDLIMRNLASEYPDRKLISVDTLGASLGEGLLVWHAVKLAKDGASMEEVAEWVDYNKLHLAHWFTVDDLKYLFRGGRVSRTSAWAATVLNIKPVLHMDDEGHLIPLDKVRGRRKSLDALLGHMDQTANRPIKDQPVFIAHGDCIEDANYVADEVRKRYGVEDIVINYVDPVIGAHSGPGTMALFFLASER